MVGRFKNPPCIQFSAPEQFSIDQARWTCEDQESTRKGILEQAEEHLYSMSNSSHFRGSHPIITLSLDMQKPA